MTTFSPSLLRALDQYLLAVESDWGNHPMGVSGLAQKYDVLPLYLDMGGICGLRRNGDVLCIEWDSERVSVVDDPRWRDIALVQGSKRYPALNDLIPRRTPGANTRMGCGETGKFQFHGSRFDNVICGCGGLGWIPEYVAAVVVLALALPFRSSKQGRAVGHGRRKPSSAAGSRPHAPRGAGRRNVLVSGV